MEVKIKLLLAGAVVSSLIPIVSPSKLPRGVSPDFAKHYSPSADTFSCINQPQIRISISRLNNDYCDCPDGSDEPGTSACAHLSPLNYPLIPRSSSDPTNLSQTNVLPGFWCENKGHKGAYVPFSHVNDGICDHERCCDGSEEWEHVGGVNCPNRCAELAKEAKKRADQVQNLRSKGMEKRAELVKEARRMRREVEERVEVLKVEIEGETIRLNELEKAVEEMSKKESGQAVKGAGPGAAGVLAGLAQSRIKELRDALLKLREERDARSKRMTELELLLARFRQEYNPNFNDEGVKRTVRGWEEYIAKNPTHGVPAEPVSTPSQEELDLEAVLKEDSEEHGINFASFLHPSDSNDTDDPTAALLNLRAYLPPSLLDYIAAQVSALRQYLIDSGVLAANPQDPSDGGAYESSKLKTARSTLEAARKSTEEMGRWKRDKEIDLEKDYGPDDVFRALKGKCATTKSGEYEYEVCWMDVSRQKGGHAGQTSLGTFTGFEMVEREGSGNESHEKVLYEEDEGADEGLKLRMKYGGGGQCWNGPQRQTTVELFCGEKDEIRKVVEEEKCVYRMEALTPAVCGEMGDSAKHGSMHDEL